MPLVIRGKLGGAHVQKERVMHDLDKPDKPDHEPGGSQLDEEDELGVLRQCGTHDLNETSRARTLRVRTMDLLLE